MNRLFVAIDLPEGIKKQLVAMECGMQGARWVAKEQLHLTLSFIGDVDDLTLQYIRTALKEVVSPAFPLNLCGIGHFPPGKYPRVLWVGLTACKELLDLQHLVESALRKVGIPPEERRFSPHITIARLKETPAKRVLALEEEHKSFASPSFTVSEFHLYSSTLSRNGAIHTRQASYALTPFGSTASSV
jgi:2'-5' RNA ligase